MFVRRIPISQTLRFMLGREVKFSSAMKSELETTKKAFLLKEMFPNAVNSARKN